MKIKLMEINQYTYIDLYKLKYYSVHEFKSKFNTCRKLKEIPHYFMFVETHEGVKPVIIVKNNKDEIQLYSFNYNAAKDKGVDVYIEEPLSEIFDDCSYVYIYDSYNDAMTSYIEKRKNYLKAQKQILIDEITRLEQERTVKVYQERERLMEELETKINELLDVYETHLLFVNTRINVINDRLNQLSEISEILENK